MKVLDKLGKSVQTFKLNDYEGKYSEVFDLTDQSAELYFLENQNEKRADTQKDSCSLIKIIKS